MDGGEDARRECFGPTHGRESIGRALVRTNSARRMLWSFTLRLRRRLRKVTEVHSA